MMPSFVVLQPLQLLARWDLSRPHNNPAYASRVELLDGNYSLMPEAEEGEADAELQYVEVN
jgi:hypothetical protein